ncbi:hypothetical protein KAK07_21880 [Ideonella sp. 4Y16]|uniref:Phosphoglycerate mutase n=1 Tax=Ideonella alba TaxID=2824118 RepID=A0A940Y498_9BURK|nr:hypothetical protein [Ideonella alba]MBQ0929979.1 hypothetical protein [Ideonella alba]MBQ0946007.1 hypothetical protein [Ideonella alba]
MHLVLPFASSLSPAAHQAAGALTLPHLQSLLSRCRRTRHDGDELSLNTPHERAIAQALGWPAVADGLLPLAAHGARADGLPADTGSGWALLSPTHWHVGTEQVSLTDPAELGLDEADSRTLFDAVRPLFEDDGWRLHWGAPSRWYVTHPSLAQLPSASLDRVVGRNVDLWLNTHPLDRPLRRLQAEVQMLLHRHPLNEAREARRQRPVNSFWLSGTGAAPTPPAAANLQVDDRLRGPALAEDWTAWADAWRTLDAGPLAEAERRVRAGEPLQLWLCGERCALQLDGSAAPPRPWWRLWPAGPLDLAELLGAL